MTNARQVRLRPPVGGLGTPAPVATPTPAPLAAGPLTPTPALAVLETPPLSDREFALLRDLIEREAGIHLTGAKKALMVARLGRRLRALGLRSFASYYERVSGPGGGAERVQMLNAISTNETSFFRERKHFDFLEREVLPVWRQEAAAARRPRCVRAWSAGCSSGEEPYSLAMVLLRHLPRSEGWQIDILATDLSTRVLERARAGLWPVEKAEAIPGEYRRSYMLRGVRDQEGTMKVGPELRAVVRFAQMNLHAESYAVPRGFDLVFCRNVLIYFDQTTRTAITNRLISHLQPGGYLFLGHAETLHATGPTDLSTVIPTVYVRRAPASHDERGRKS
jgi:chemotaxis protein methyltransferase CheR